MVHCVALRVLHQDNSSIRKSLHHDEQSIFQWHQSPHAGIELEEEWRNSHQLVAESSVPASHSHGGFFKDTKG